MVNDVVAAVDGIVAPRSTALNNAHDIEEEDTRSREGDEKEGNYDTEVAEDVISGFDFGIDCFFSFAFAFASAGAGAGTAQHGAKPTKARSNKGNKDILDLKTETEIIYAPYGPGALGEAGHGFGGLGT